MNNVQKNILKHFMILALVLFTSSVSANVGKVVYGYGKNYAYDNDGNRRDLRKGSIINEGDTMVTGRGRVHVRMIDGGFISVFPNSEYKIDQFKYSGEKFDDRADTKTAKKTTPAKASKEDRGFFSLLKGAARQVTGILGKTYNENFKLRTTVATIGIRGTGFLARLCQADCFDELGNPMQDGMYAKNNTGVITMKTNAGIVSLAQGQSAFAASSEDSPRQVVQPPIVYNIVTPDIELYDFDEQVIDTRGDLAGDGLPGLPPVVPVDPLIDPPIDPPSLNIVNLEYVTSVDLSFPAPLGGIDTADILDSVQQTGDEISHFEGTGVYIDAGALVFDKAGATLAEQGKDTNLGVLWNRWSSGYTLTEMGTDVTTLGTESGNDIHLIGSENFTPDLAGLSGRGQVDYVSTGGTSPTITGFAGSQVGTQTVTAQIDYASGAVNNFQLDATFSNAAISANLLTVEFLGGTSGNQVSLIGSCVGAGCNSATPVGFDGTASINLVGPNAEGIYGVYNLTNQENAVSGSYVATDTLVPVAIRGQ